MIRWLCDKARRLAWWLPLPEDDEEELTDEETQAIAQEEFDQLRATFYGLIGIFAENESPIVEICDVLGMEHFPVRIVQVSEEYVVYDVLDKRGFATGKRHVRLMGGIVDVRLDSPDLRLMRVRRMFNYEPPEEQEADDAEDSDDEDPTRVE